MANLDDLTAKIKIDFSDVDAAILKAKLLGDTLKKELGSGDISRATKDVAAGMEVVGASAGDAAAESEGLFKQLSSFKSELSEYMIPALVGLGVVLAPLAALLGSFTIGLSASLTVASLGVGAFAGLAAGLVLLADKTGQLNGPMQALKDHLQSVADTLGIQAAPAARLVLTTVDQLLDPVGLLASQTIQWADSNNRLGQALSLATGFAHDFFDVAQNELGPAIGDFLDQWLSRGPEWEDLWKDSLSFLSGGIEGLLQNLTRLSDWFFENLPTIGPETKAVFGGLGEGMQDAGNIINSVLIPLFDGLKGHESELTQDIRFTIQAFALLVDAAILLGAALDGLLKLFQSLEPAIAILGHVLGQQADSHHEAATAANNQSSATSGLTKFIDSLTGALQRNKSAIDSVVQGLQNQLADSIQVEEAEQNLDRVMKDANSTEADKEQALLGVSNALAQMSQDTRTASGDTDAASKKNQDAAAALRQAAKDAQGFGAAGADAAAKFNSVAAQIEAAAGGIAQSINSIPTYKTITINVAANDPAGIAAAAFGGYPISAYSGQYQPHAMGGPVVPGGAYLVGEQGPELLAMGSTGGYVYPTTSAQTQAAAADPNTGKLVQLSSEQNALLRAFLQAVVNQPAPVGRWPYQGRTV